MWPISKRILPGRYLQQTQHFTTKIDHFLFDTIFSIQFSKKLNKLYCCPGVSCPIDLSVSTPPAPGSMIRATAVFAKAEHIQSLIQRCENHQKKRQFEPTDEQATDSSILSHFIRSQHKAALYHQDMFTARQSVLVPYEKPPSN